MGGDNGLEDENGLLEMGGDNGLEDNNIKLSLGRNTFIEDLCIVQCIVLLFVCYSIGTIVW